MSVSNGSSSLNGISPVAQSKTASDLTVKVKGKSKRLRSAIISGRTVVLFGKLVKIAKVSDEEFLTDEPVRNPESFIQELKQSKLNGDLFTFIQRIPDETPRYSYYYEWDNFAVIPISNYDDWWKSIPYSAQKAVKKSRKQALDVREVEYTDEFVRGIQAIYSETPVRQGRAFWHYKQDFEAVKAANSTFPGRNVYIGAYVGEELAGFVRITKVGKVAQFLQILSMKKHQDKGTTSALISKSVEFCVENGMSHLVYGNYVYQDENSSLTTFKKNTGFQKMLLPRYYIPLSATGRLVLKLKLHHGIKERIPQRLLKQLLTTRKWLAETVVTRFK